eukprot:g77553.t1
MGGTDPRCFFDGDLLLPGALDGPALTPAHFQRLGRLLRARLAAGLGPAGRRLVLVHYWLRLTLTPAGALVCELLPNLDRRSEHVATAGRLAVVRGLVRARRRARVRAQAARHAGRAGARAQRPLRARRGLRRLHALRPWRRATRAQAPTPTLWVVDELSLFSPAGLLRLLDVLARLAPSVAGLLLLGDSAQLPSMGHGCVLALAQRLFPACCACLDTVRRGQAGAGGLTQVQRLARTLRPAADARGVAEVRAWPDAVLARFRLHVGPDELRELALGWFRQYEPPGGVTSGAVRAGLRQLATVRAQERKLLNEWLAGAAGAVRTADGAPALRPGLNVRLKAPRSCPARRLLAQAARVFVEQGDLCAEKVSGAHAQVLTATVEAPHDVASPPAAAEPGVEPEEAPPRRSLSPRRGRAGGRAGGGHLRRSLPSALVHHAAQGASPQPSSACHRSLPSGRQEVKKYEF